MVQNKNKKIKVAFIIKPDLNWIGGINYFKSLIGSINDADKELNIKIYVFTGRFEKNFNEKKYNNITIIKTSFLDKKGFFSTIKKLSSYLFTKYDPIITFLLKKYSINVLSHHRAIKGFNCISWFPDFQHIHYSKFFSKKEIFQRNKIYNDYIKNSEILIVSSETAKKDLIKFKGDSKKIKILNFTPEIDFSKIKKKKYLKKEINIDKKFIFTPNQFWMHKNHICIIEALKILKSKGVMIQCIFTGSKNDHRNPDHFDSLMEKIKLYKLEDIIKYKGILPYSKIINLLFHADLIINPSLFEGWSTSVEESKIFSKKILLSNIDTHIEQNPKNAIYFDPLNPKDLAKKIYKSLETANKQKFIQKHNIRKYQINRIMFAKKFNKIVQEIKFN